MAIKEGSPVREAFVEGVLHGIVSVMGLEAPSVSIVSIVPSEVTTLVQLQVEQSFNPGAHLVTELLGGIQQKVSDGTSGFFAQRLSGSWGKVDTVCLLFISIYDCALSDCLDYRSRRSQLKCSQ